MLQFLQRVRSDRPSRLLRRISSAPNDEAYTIAGGDVEDRTLLILNEPFGHELHLVLLNADKTTVQDRDR
jgi:hypothetical protein